MRRLSLIATALVACVALWLFVRHQSAPVTPGASDAQSPSSAAPADALSVGSLRLQRCEIGLHSAGVPTMRAFCTLFAVPENWSEPAGRKITLHVAIVKADLAHAHDDFLTFLDGGPGGAATQDYPLVAAAFAPLHRQRSVLLIDQRGTGDSNALRCSGADNAHTPAPGSAAVGEPASALNLRRTAQCLAALRTHAAPEFYTTTDAIQDLEAVRLAIGGPQLDLVAVSYGTRVAQQYASRYPASVRSIVLDSPVPNSLILLSEHARNLDAALQELFGRCRASAACRQQFGDPAATLARLRARLRQAPQAVSGRDPATFAPLKRSLSEQDLTSIVRMYMYSPLTAALLPLMLQQADQGDWGPLMSQSKLLTDDLNGQLSSGMELSVLCSEDASALRARPEDQQSVFGTQEIDNAKASCSLWPQRPLRADFHQPFQTQLPVLVLSGAHDPVTPSRYGSAIAAVLPHARWLLAAGQGHGVMTVGCMPKLIARFVDTLDPKALDAHCLEPLGNTPAFTSYNGAPP